jgi:hypothetical protein
MFWGFLFGGSEMGETKVTCAVCGEHVLLANAQHGERSDWTWSCACARRTVGISDAEVSKDIFNELYRVVQKLESHLGRAKKVDSIELLRGRMICSDEIDVAEFTICYTDYNHRLMPDNVDFVGCDYRTNKWVVTCPRELQFIERLAGHYGAMQMEEKGGRLFKAASVRC